MKLNFSNFPFVFFLLVLSLPLLLIGCGPAGSNVHNLDPDEMRRAEIHAQAFFNSEHPAGTNAAGELIKKKGTFQSCRPQDSNSNGLVTCTGVIPTLGGGFATVTRYCGYRKGGVLGCSDKDQT